MPTRNRLALLLFAAALPPLAAGGCATPEPLVRLAPIGPRAAWLSGRPVVAKEEGGIRVAVAFDQQVDDALAMRVEVENDSDEPVDVSPRRVTFVTCPTAQRESCGDTQPVTDPEQMLMALDAARSRERAQAANDHAAMAPLLVLSVVGDAASLTSRHPTNNSSVVASEMESNEARHESSFASIVSERERWSAAALRRTTLFPGHGIAGYVSLPTDKGAHRVWLMVRVGDHHFTFGFDQSVIPVS
jgi:hypothetical protein